MMTGSIVAEAPRGLRQPIEAHDPGDSDYTNYSRVYLEFILFWTMSDVDSYYNALAMVTSREEKDLLLSMARRKEEMFITLSAHRGTDSDGWFEAAFGNGTRSSANDFLIENDFRTIQGLNDTFHFAYRIEYQSLNKFQRANRSDLETSTQVILGSAVERQQQHILYLDSRLFCANRIAEPSQDRFSLQRTDPRWALTARTWS